MHEETVGCNTTDTVTQEWMEATTKRATMIQQGTYATASERLYEMCIKGIEVSNPRILLIEQDDMQFVERMVETKKYNILREYVQSKGDITREEWEAKLKEMNIL